MRSRRKNRDILIDLTSLLDVVFIMLMVIACCQQLSIKDAAESAADYDNAVKETLAEKALYEDQIDTHDRINEYVCKLSVNADFNEDNITDRNIRVLLAGEEIETFEILGNDKDGNLDKFRQFVEEKVKAGSSAGQPVLLSVNEDDDKILYRDEMAIKDLFGELAQNYDNVYLINKGEE